jgi:hypothetical protein
LAEAVAAAKYGAEKTKVFLRREGFTSDLRPEDFRRTKRQGAPARKGLPSVAWNWLRSNDSVTENGLSSSFLS